MWIFTTEKINIARKIKLWGFLFLIRLGKWAESKKMLKNSWIRDDCAVDQSIEETGHFLRVVEFGGL